MKKQESKKKTRTLTALGIFMLLFISFGATYAYFAASLGGGTNANINAATGTTDSLVFDAGDPIRIHATLENFAEGMESLKGSTTATATLKANNTTNQATGKYNIFFIIDDNDFVYSTEDGHAELVLKVTDPNGNEVTSITGLKRVERGFDITTRIGGFLIAEDYEIETTSTTEQMWLVEVTLVNLDANQNANNGKSLNGRFYITKEQEATYELAEINSVEAITKYNSITTNLKYTEGSSGIDKYYYAIEEDASSVALLGLNKVARLAAKELNYIESDEATHTFVNLKPNTSYKVYSYAKDKQGINSNVYETSITTAEYELPKVTGLTHTSELYKITLTAISEGGSNKVSKYYFSKDNGATWSEGQESATYVFDNLLDTTTYNIKVKVSDSEDKYSTEYYKTIATSTYINPTVSITSTTQTANSITVNASGTKGSNNIAKYMYSIDGGSTWVTNTSSSTTNSYTFNNLLSKTNYNIRVKVIDTNNRESTVVSKSVTTSASTTTLAAKVKSKYTSQGSNGIYYHTSSLANGAGDNSYRYAGANPNNYVCFGSTASICPSKNLYRIIGVYGDQVKLIHATYATTAEIGTAAEFSNYPNFFYWSGSESNRSNIWSSSTLNTSSLNGTFLTKLGTTWANKIATTTWNVGGGIRDNLVFSNAKTAYDYEVGANKINTTYNAKIGLPYVNEYYYAATPTYWTYKGLDTTGNNNDYRKSIGNNWMKNDFIFWTISRESHNSYGAFFVVSGFANSRSIRDTGRIRPSFNLVSSVKTSGGSGTESNPYRIEI